MSLDVYAIKDLKKGVYGQPFFVPFGTEPHEVIVGFERDLKKGVMQLFLDPKDFELSFLGFFDTKTGIFYQDDQKIVRSGTEIVGMPESPVRVGDDHNGVVDLDDGKSN